ncbi:hypothetical protein BAZOLSSOX_541 [uncultured Gammaproteobacteria bacterium]|nr:hypothetical protein BAZOLSSOX_541 [uncultured Gammaproteobacteria bacterium]
MNSSPHTINTLLVFLSHLCGGELLEIYYCSSYAFLSHLCGGEYEKRSLPAGLLFLSHLCGGE